MTIMTVGLYIAHSWTGLDTNFLQGLQRWPLVGGAFCISQPSLSTLLPKLWFFLGSQTTETRNTYSTNIHLQKNWTCKTAKPLLSTQLRALLSICRRRCASWQLYRIRINPTECKNSKLQKTTGQSIARLRQALLCFNHWTMFSWLFRWFNAHGSPRVTNQVGDFYVKPWCWERNLPAHLPGRLLSVLLQLVATRPILPWNHLESVIENGENW